MANWYCSSVDYTAVAQFAISHAYSIGDIVRQLATPSVGNERCFRCTTAGTSAGSEATWTLTKGATTTQGGAVFTEVTGNETYQAAGAWAAPHARLGNAFASGWMAAGDTCYVAANHAEATSGSITCSTGSVGTLTSIICVDQSGTGHVPPQAGDTRTTAVVQMTGSFNTITISMLTGYVYGIIFQSGASFPTVNLGASGAILRFDACQFVSQAAGQITLISGSAIEWNNTSLTPFSAAGGIACNTALFRWKNTATPVITTALTNIIGDGGGTVLLDGLDFSALAHTRMFQGNGASRELLVMVNCKLNAGTAVTSGSSVLSGTSVDSIATDNGNKTYRSERYQWAGALTTNTAIIHTGGASDGTTGISWQILSTTNARWATPFECFPIAIWNAATGSAKTVSLETVVNAAAVLNNDQLWMDLEYLGTASATLASLGTTTKATALSTAAAVTASTAAWDTLATARANSHANILGDIISVSSNAGRIFFCTTAGTTSGSLPGGYASCVDGGSVTDGTAVFRAGCRMTLSLSITPQMAGLFRATVKVGIASATIYVDPLLTIV